MEVKKKYVNSKQSVVNVTNVSIPSLFEVYDFDSPLTFLF